ncbi:MAG: hypothetical protein NTW50_01610 [Candidatus Berkelbacteria bacterium]|nr:hypothetical protein [Candidatus Berkelbacteria bacterium]
MTQEQEVEVEEIEDKNTTVAINNPDHHIAEIKEEIREIAEDNSELKK